ncbi:hypothetical protein HAX54_018006, partial [Datura stramonium]|nr:hypothetical protein [Datura stramonium]
IIKPPWRDIIYSEPIALKSDSMGSIFRWLRNRRHNLPCKFLAVPVKLLEPEDGRCSEGPTT